MLELLTAYALKTSVFLVVHLVLVLRGLTIAWKSRTSIAEHLALLNDEMRENRGDDEWSELITEYRSLDREASLPDIRAVYERLLYTPSAELSRTINLFLLTGVMGTLYGLFSASREFVKADANGNGVGTLARLGGSGTEWRMFEALTPAFSVTIAAVGLAIVFSFIRRSVESVSDRAEFKIMKMWSVQTVDANDQVSVMRNIGAQLQNLGHTVTNNVGPGLAALRGHLEQGDAHGRLLANLSATCESLAISVTTLTTAVNELKTGITEQRAQHVSLIQEQHANAKTTFETLNAEMAIKFTAMGNELTNLSARLTEMPASLKTATDAYAAQLAHLAAGHFEKVEEQLPGLKNRLENLSPTADQASQAMQTVQDGMVKISEAVEAAVARMENIETSIAHPRRPWWAFWWR